MCIKIFLCFVSLFLVINSIVTILDRLCLSILCFCTISSKCLSHWPLQAPESKVDAIKFAPFWNAIIRSFREEDLINNR